MGFRGHQAKLYYETAWVDGQNVPAMPTWVEIKRAMDLSLDLGEGDAEAGSRESNFNMDVGGMSNAIITFGYRIEDNAEAVYDKLLASKFNYTPLLIALLKGSVLAGSHKGYQFTGRIKEVEESTPLDGAAVANVTLVPFPARNASGAIIDVTQITGAV